MAHWLLHNVRFSHCRTRWEYMIGTEKARRCPYCQVVAFDVNGLEEEEICKRIVFGTGFGIDEFTVQLCRRFDGTMTGIERQCPFVPSWIRSLAWLSVSIGIIVGFIYGLFRIAVDYAHISSTLAQLLTIFWCVMTGGCLGFGVAGALVWLVQTVGQALKLIPPPPTEAEQVLSLAEIVEKIANKESPAQEVFEDIELAHRRECAVSMQLKLETDSQSDRDLDSESKSDSETDSESGRVANYVLDRKADSD